MLRFVLSILMVVAPATAVAAPDAVPVPFESIHNGIFVRVLINGTGPYSFNIDTDTTPSVIDVGLAKKLNIRATGPGGWGSGIGSGKLAFYPVNIPQLALGSTIAQSLYAFALDLTALGSYVGTHIDGVLGTSFLNGRILQINYPCHTAAFLSEAPADPITARFRWNDAGGNTIDDVWVGGTKVSATFDSADGGFGVVTAKGIADLHLEDAARSGQATMAQGYLGQENATLGEINDVRIGSANLGSLQIKFLPNQHSSYALNIGNLAVDRYVVTMDYVHGTITLSKPGPCSAPASQ